TKKIGYGMKTRRASAMRMSTAPNSSTNASSRYRDSTTLHYGPVSAARGGCPTILGPQRARAGEPAAAKASLGRVALRAPALPRRATDKGPFGVIAGSRGG